MEAQPPTPLQVQQWLQRHLTLLQRERQAELEEYRLLLSSVSPKVLQDNGLALCRLGVLNTSIGMGGKKLVRLHRPTAYHADTKLPPHSFRSGDVVSIIDEVAEDATDAKGKKAAGAGAGAGKDKHASDGIDGVISKVAESDISVAIARRNKKGGEGEEEPLPLRCRLVKVANEVTWERTEKNLTRLATKLSIPVKTSRGIRGGAGFVADNVGGGGAADRGDASSDEDDELGAASSSKSRQTAIDTTAPLPSPPASLPPLSPLLETLLGLRCPSPLPTSLPAPPLPLFNENLNSSQTAALSRALASRDVHLIHGPPGTGKTTCLVELVLQLALGRGERVLVAGSSNLAVDNLAARLIPFRKGREKDLKPIRVGHPARILPVLQNHTLDYLATSSDPGQLLTDTRNELQAAYSSLSAGTRSSDKPSAGNKSTTRRGTSSQTNKRLGGSERKRVWEEVRALRAELRQRERGLFSTTLAEANVVMSTLHGASGGVLERSLGPDKPAGTGGEGNSETRTRGFDTVIVDEACQALEASTWGAILGKMVDGANGRLILAGDDKQLGPVVKSESQSKSSSGVKKGKGATKKGKDKGAKSGQSEGASKGSDKKEAAENSAPEELSAAVEKLDLASSQDTQDPTGEGEADSDSELAAPLSSDTTAPLRLRRTLRPPRSLQSTLFSRLISLYGPSPPLKSLLTVQYRMNSAIMTFPNEAMYDGQLEAHESCKDGWLGDGRIDGWKGEAGDLEEPKGGRVVFYDTAGAELYENLPPASGTGGPSTDSKSNEHEVQLVMAHLALLISAGVPPLAVTILAPYSAQISLLSHSLSPSTSSSSGGDLAQLKLTPEEFASLEIGTIDALQGREKDVVIISLVRSNEQGEVGFLSESRRLNVAMTRAKRQLVVIGDSETISKAKGAGRAEGEYLRKWMAWLEENAIVEPVLP